MYRVVLSPQVEMETQTLLDFCKEANPNPNP